MTDMTDTEILDTLEASFERWRKKTAIRFDVQVDVQVGEVVFTTGPRDTRPLRECLVQAIEKHVIGQITKKLTK